MNREEVLQPQRLDGKDRHLSPPSWFIQNHPAEPDGPIFSWDGQKQEGHPGEDGRGRVAVSPQGPLQLLQLLQHGSLALVVPQGPVPDQPAVMIQRSTEAGATGAAPRRHIDA